VDRLDHFTLLNIQLFNHAIGQQLKCFLQKFL
jgi:hypothetical protein